MTAKLREKSGPKVLCVGSALMEITLDVMQIVLYNVNGVS